MRDENTATSSARLPTTGDPLVGRPGSAAGTPPGPDFITQGSLAIADAAEHEENSEPDRTIWLAVSPGRYRRADRRDPEDSEN